MSAPVPNSPIVEDSKYATPAMLSWMNAQGSTSATVNAYAMQITGATGAIVFGPAGWTCVRTGVGAYTVTHNLGVTTYHAVATIFPSVRVAAGATQGVGLSAVNANTAAFVSWNAFASATDQNFGFVLTTL